MLSFFLFYCFIFTKKLFLSAKRRKKVKFDFCFIIVIEVLYNFRELKEIGKSNDITVLYHDYMVDVVTSPNEAATLYQSHMVLVKNLPKKNYIEQKVTTTFFLFLSNVISFVK